MPRSLPPEILDLILDHLCGEPTTLKTCCLVSKSWIHRTRKPLFAHVEFCVSVPRIELWVETFPDPRKSPAHYTRTLSIHYFIGYPRLIKAACADTFSSFRSVVHLHMTVSRWRDEMVPLTPLHGLSPVLRSLRLSFAALPDSEIFGLICSFPLLKDLALHCMKPEPRDGQWTAPSTSPKLTGSLELSGGIGGVQLITCRLLDLPNGLHFTKIRVSWLCGRDIAPTADLVSRCSGTVQSLEVTSCFTGTFPLVSV